MASELENKYKNREQSVPRLEKLESVKLHKTFVNNSGGK